MVELILTIINHNNELSPKNLIIPRLPPQPISLKPPLSQFSSITKVIKNIIHPGCFLHTLCSWNFSELEQVPVQALAQSSKFLSETWITTRSFTLSLMKQVNQVNQVHHVNQVNKVRHVNQVYQVHHVNQVYQVNWSKFLWETWSQAGGTFPGLKSLRRAVNVPPGFCIFGIS